MTDQDLTFIIPWGNRADAKGRVPARRVTREEYLELRGLHKFLGHDAALRCKEKHNPPPLPLFNEKQPTAEAPIDARPMAVILAEAIGERKRQGFHKQFVPGTSRGLRADDRAFAEALDSLKGA